jgi:hypothetical protein
MPIKAAIFKEPKTRNPQLGVSGITKKRLNIQTIKLSNRLLKELCLMLNEEYERMEQSKEEPTLLLLAERKMEHTATANYNFKEFAEIEIPVDLRRIILQVRSHRKSIWIEIDATNGMLSESYYTVEGTDMMWIHGMRGSLEDIFIKYRTRLNNFFQDWRKSSPVYALIVAGQTAVLYLWLMTIDASFRLFLDITIIGVSIMSAAAWHLLFRWLFPRTEMEHMGRLRVRKAVLGGIGAIIISLIALFISRFLPI